ncbi:uncharacterized protein LOC128862503 [Anastrepha ludens]|uniref:uncharacterized protein LOC128862503 n=1 Tax=Anastrepha ludens TaxID=28586 RepID=UPI0023B046EB|nr:uncharacterized protein LOC128862503 [Anastrepha ludens]
MMTATMAAKDTYQFTRIKASTTIITNTTLTPITTITTTNPINSSQRRQPFYQQPPAVTTTTLTTPTTAVQTAMGRAINIGFTGYTHAYINDHRAGFGEINEKVLQDEVTGTRVTATAAAAVDIGIDVVDDDEGNVDGNGNTDSVAGMACIASTVVGDDVNFAVDSRKGMPTGGIEMDDGDDSESFGSMETLSDNVAVWVDGEKHWVAGVDANTTCADLIGALLNYQNAQQLQQKQYQQQQHTFNVNTGKNNNNNNNNNSKTSSSTTNTAINQSMLIKTSTNTKENCDPLLAVSGELTIGGCFPAAPSLALTVPATSRAASIAGNCLTQACEYAIVKQHRHCEEYLDGKAKVFDVLPVHDGTTRKECELLLRRLAAANSINATTNGATFTALPAALQRSSSPSLNFNTQVSSLLSTDKDSGMGSPVGSSRSARLRRRKYKSATTVSWLAQANTLHPRVSQRAVAAFSGLGNTLTNAHGGNSNSKHIAAIEQALGEDTLLATDGLDGLGGGVSANERLLKIILAQDETIHRQLALLREKERQISKIEEEKHRVRERELGKNYLLETYLKGLDEANGEPDLEACTDVGLADSPVNEFSDVRFAHTAAVDCGDVVGNDDVEIYIDEPYQRTARTFKALITPETTTPTTTTKDIMLAKTRDFNLDARHSKKMKGDFTNGVEAVMTAGKIDGNESPTTSSQGNQKEIDVQLFWLEKIYALNKQLQREEEMLLKLHAKIRKHQVKRAYQTKREVLQQIEKLDAELTLQCCDIRAVENKLHASNEQLKQKLCVLERLSKEFLETIETPPTDAAEGTTNSVAAVDADSQATVNRMPDVINNEDHNLVTLLRATEMARENALQVADEWHAKQTTTEQLVMVQQSCPLQQLPEEPADVWHMQDAKFRLPHAMQSASQVLHTDLNIISGQNALAPTNAVAETITVPLPAAHTTTIQETTIVPKVVAASHAATKITETSCIATSSTAKATAITIAIASATATTTNMTSAITTAATSCNVSAVPPLAEEKQVTTLRLPQQQQQQQQLGQEQLALPKPEDSARQCVDADDVLINVLAATSVVGLPQSNYPISCINHAAIHATSQLSTGQIIVAANADADCGGGGGGRGAVSMKLITPEQKLPPATAAFPASNLASAASENTAQQQQEQLRQYHYQPQSLLQRQQINLNGCMNDSCVSIQNNNNDKNLLPPSHAAYTKTLQKQMFGPKSLNQIQPAEPPSKIILVSTAAATMTTPSATITTSPMHVGTHAGYAMPPMITPLRPTTPAALLTSPVIPFNATTTQCSSVDLTQLGTLV